MVDKLSSGLFINELLADNAGGSAVDVDGDGTTNKADEYVELQNASGSTLSLDGIQVWSEKNGLLYSFLPGETLAPGETATILGNYTGTPPPGYYSAGNPESVNFLPDGEGQKFDTIFLYDSNSNTYVTLSYGNPPRTPTLPSGFPTDATQRGSGETIDSSSPNGAAFARDPVTGELTEGTPTPGDPDPVCLVSGTLIATERGPVPVECLRPGDRVITGEAGIASLRAVGHCRVSAAQIRALPHLAPVYFPEGLIGNRRALGLSPNHRIRMSGVTVELWFGVANVLAPAKAFSTAQPSLRDGSGSGVSYYHLLFDRHVTVNAEGVWVESLYLGDVGRHWAAAQRRAGQLLEASRGMTDRIHHASAAYHCLRAYEARVLLSPPWMAGASAPMAVAV